MPFDGVNFEPRRDPPGPPKPDAKTLSVIVLVVAVSLLVMPFSMAAFIDIVRYIRPH